MRPERGKSTVEIPLTLDVAASAKYLTKAKVYIGYLIIIGVVLVAVILPIIFKSLTVTVGCIVVGVIAILGMRYIYFEEAVYKKRYKDMIEHQNIYSTDVFWSIYEVAEGKMPVCYLKNGQKALFVGFEKDIQIGATMDNAQDHWDAITQAYRQMAYKNIVCTHIDYMDNIGKDKRLDTLIESLMQTPNSDLRKLLGRTFEYQRQLMQDTYLMYDVYVFYYNGDDLAFKTDIEEILNIMLQANYSYYYYLRIDDLRELAKALYGLDGFSALRACESVFAQENVRRRIKVISYEKDGVIEKVNLTQEEQKQQAAEELERKRQKRNKAQRKKVEEAPKELNGTVIHENEGDKPADVEDEVVEW